MFICRFSSKLSYKVSKASKSFRYDSCDGKSGQILVFENCLLLVYIENLTRHRTKQIIVHAQFKS